MILVVMAAGMGSRFGGSKQTCEFGPNGEFIIDYSIYDAIKAGFKKVVFIIRRENLDEFKNSIGKRIEDKIEVCYAFQDINDIPSNYSVPSDRIKPWGTGHALLCAKDYIDDNFVIINADDFYGRDSFQVIYDYLSTVDSKSKNYSMVSYYLTNTLSNNGSVSRGVCNVVNNRLVDITERTSISRDGHKIFYEDNGMHELRIDTLVSVNLWGFTPMIFADAERYFNEFFESCDNLSKAEFYLPTIVKKSIADKLCDVRVLNTTSRFNGVTYKEDKEQLKNDIANMIANDIYPSNLWE